VVIDPLEQNHRGGCRGCRDLRYSQRGVDHSVNVSAEGFRVHRRQLRPPFDEHVAREGFTAEGHQERDRPTSRVTVIRSP
jgi:hypothetical protein